MSISHSNFGSSILRLVAAEAVASTETSRHLRKAAHHQELAQEKLANSERETANALRSGSGWVKAAQSVASAAQACVKVGQAGAELNQHLSQAPALERGYTQATTGTLEARAAGRAALEATPLGDQTVGDRFSDSQLDALLGGADTAEAFEAAGFTPDQAEALEAFAQNPTAEGAQLFLWSQREDPAVAEASRRREEIQGTIESMFTESVVTCLEQAAGTTSPRAQRHQDLATYAQTLADRLSEDTSAHEGQLFEIEMAFRRQQSRGL
ncbi:MAG: hypothetical protein IPG45_15150 [Deltaproteobacteria bacterium]|nr:hypothetical protein [Deltaproteobacteria bacterium]